METKISEFASCVIKDKIDKTRVYFYDNFPEEGEQCATLILTDGKNIDDDNNIKIYIELSTSDLIRLKHAINNHLEQIKEYREFVKTENM